MRKISIKRIHDHLSCYGYKSPFDIDEEGDKINITIYWGDWKHGHGRMKFLMSLLGFKHEDSVVTETDGSDAYSAIHTFSERDSYNIRSAGEYTGRYKDIAKRLKEGDGAAIDEAAQLLFPLIPDDCTLIPMPSHTGEVTYTGELCERLSSLKGVPTARALVCMPHISMCEAKRNTKERGERLPYPEELQLIRYYKYPIKGVPIVIDNVVASGTTAVAALNALGCEKACVLAVAEDNNCDKIPQIRKE